MVTIQRCVLVCCVPEESDADPCLSRQQQQAYRIYEACEAGSIPIVALDQYYQDHACQHAFAPFIKSGAPFVYLNGWKGLGPYLKKISKQPLLLRQMQANVMGAFFCSCFLHHVSRLTVWRVWIRLVFKIYARKSPRVWKSAWDQVPETNGLRKWRLRLKLTWWVNHIIYIYIYITTTLFLFALSLCVWKIHEQSDNFQRFSFVRVLIPQLQ